MCTHTWYRFMVQRTGTFLLGIVYRVQGTGYRSCLLREISSFCYQTQPHQQLYGEKEKYPRRCIKCLLQKKNTILNNQPIKIFQKKIQHRKNPKFSKNPKYQHSKSAIRFVLLS